MPDPDERWDRLPSHAETRDVAVVPDFGSFMRQVFPEGRPGSEMARGSVVTTTRTHNARRSRRDYDNALSMLQRASDAFPALLLHCQQLEADMRHLRADAQAEVLAARGETQQWQQIAVAMKMHIEESEHQLAMMRERLDAAEERLASGESLAAAAEQQASLAMGITTMFHDKIVNAFGVGSAAHATLDAIDAVASPAREPSTREGN